jgi:S-DNA-T family DNA segregation ATPase FtsK/SpoIIIE
MTYSLNTLTRDGAGVAPAAPQTLWSRFAQEILLLLGAGLLLFVTVALWSYHPQDPAWSTSGSGVVVRNGVGRWGAWVADLAYFLLGFSAWWCVAAGFRIWLVALARWLRGAGPQDVLDKPLWQRSLWVFWLGLAVLLLASCGMEWTRLYRLESNLPGHSGGVLGYLVGAAAVGVLGFNGSALLGIVLTLVGVSMVFRFSWGQLAENMGAHLDALIRSRHEKREIEEDLALGQQALRERQQALSPQAVEPEWDLDPPVHVSDRKSVV